MLEIGEIKQIHGYKHNGQLHRIWETVYVIDETEDCLIVGNEKTTVIEKDGRTWVSSEPSVSLFYKKRWMNVICMLKKNDIAYYVNLASPICYDEEAIKYIDYDLDIKIINGQSRILDETEFVKHKDEMKYPEDIELILRRTIKEVLVMIQNKEVPFNNQFVKDAYNKLLELMRG